MSVPHTGYSGIDAPRAPHGNAMGNCEEQHRDSHFSPSSASGSVSGSASSSCPSATGLKAVDLDEPDSMVIGNANANANRCQPPHASASGRGGVAYHHHPWRGTPAAGVAASAAAAGSSARHLLLQSMSPSSSSSSPSPTATSTETSSLVKVKTDTPDGTRKSRARKRHRHRKTRSRSENDLDSPSTVNSGRDEGDVMTGHADKGYRARTAGNVQNAEPREEQYQGVLPGREASKPIETSDVGDADTAEGSARPRASTNSTGPMIVDSNVSRRSTVSSQQDTAQQPYHPQQPQPQPQASAPAPFPNVALSGLHPPRANPHHPFNRRGRGSFGGTSAAAAAAAAASASTTAAGRNTVAIRLGPARRAIPTAPTSTTPPCRQLSTTTTVGSISITVFLPGMKQPITFHDVPQKRYTNLPDHRPPLRRDKPVRIMLPGSGRTQGLRGSYSGDRLIYPATDRSFIFIPRELRPNHRALSNFFGRGSGRGRGRGGGHVSGASLDSSAYSAEMLRQGYHSRRQQQQQQQQQQLSYAAAGHSHSHSLSGSTPYLDHLFTRSRRSSSYGLQPQSPAAALPPRPMPAGLANPLPPHAAGPGPRSLARLPDCLVNALQPPSEAQFAVPGPEPGMMMNSPVVPHAVTAALASAPIPTTYPATFPPINPATVPAPPYPPPSHRHNPSGSTSSVQVGSTLINIPMKSAPTAAPVPILQPQPQKRISMPSIINHVQCATPPPLQRHRQGQAEESGELQEQRYQIPSPAFSAAHHPLQPYDPVVAYPSSTAGEVRGNADNASSAPHDSDRFDRGTTSGDYYTSPYQAFMPSAASGLMMPHTVAHERNGTVYYNYEYSCDTSTPSFPYQQQRQQQTQTVDMQQPLLPDPSAQLYQHAVPPSSSGHFLPMYHPLNSTGYNMPPPPPGPSTAGGFPQFQYSTPVTQGHYGHQHIYSHPSHMQSMPMSMPMNLAMQHTMAAVPGSMPAQPAHMHNIMSSKHGN